MILLIIALLFFTAALLGLIAIYLGYAAVKSSPAYELKKRLRNLALEAHGNLPPDLKIEIIQEMPRFDKILYKIKLVRKLHEHLDKAGLKIDAKVFILIVLVFALAGFVIGAALQRGIPPALILLLIFSSIPFFYLRMQTTKRINRFTEQFASALDMMSRSLKAGHSLASAVQVVANEMSDPVSSLFKSVYEEQAYGLSLRDALANMIVRMDTTDLRFFVTAVSIYREIGGNLSEILERLAHTIRERLKIRRQVRVYTAQARFSGYVLAALPICTAILFYFMAPDYIGELFEVKVGRFLVATALILQIIGFFIIRKIINIRI
jgi:tight adherence protein B